MQELSYSTDADVLEISLSGRNKINLELIKWC